MTDITNRGHTRTNYEPEEFVDAIDAANLDGNMDRVAEIRETFRNLDGGRFYDMLDEAHNVLAKSDLERRETFVENYSPHLIRWIRAFGAVEDLDRFPDLIE